ncbi:MAG: Replicative DNA helicase, partial [Clostridium butyricum DORA_1]
MVDHILSGMTRYMFVWRIYCKNIKSSKFLKAIENVVDVAEKKIFNIAENRTSKDFESLGDVLERGFMQIEKLFNNKGEVTGVPSGFTDLDAKTSGFQSGDMVLIAARPSMGKTTFALNIAEHVALREHKSVVIFS